MAMKPFTLLAALAPFTLGACATLFAPPSPYAYDKKGDLVEFNYAWSAETSRQPALVRQLRGDLERAFRDTATAAEADRATAKAAGRTFNGHRYSRRWTTAGQSAQLLSLDGRLKASTGGPASTSVDGLLWDRKARARVPADRLFASDDAAQLVRGAGCTVLAGDRASAACAASASLALIPGDDNHNRRFDHFRFASPGNEAAPMVANVPISAAMLAAIKPSYRAQFEVGQPQ
jgi:hypothetical protein